MLSFINTWLSLLVPLFCVWGRFSEVTCCRLEELPLVLVKVDLLGAKSFSFYLSGNLFDFWSLLLLIRQSCSFSFWNPFKWWIIFLLLFSKVWSFSSVVWFWDFSICNVMYLSVDLFFVEGELSWQLSVELLRSWGRNKEGTGHVSVRFCCSYWGLVDFLKQMFLICCIPSWYLPETLTGGCFFEFSPVVVVLLENKSMGLPVNTCQTLTSCHCF